MCSAEQQGVHRVIQSLFLIDVVACYVKHPRALATSASSACAIRCGSLVLSTSKSAALSKSLHALLFRDIELPVFMIPPGLGEVLLEAKFFRQMRIVETLILAAGQAQDQLPLGKRNGPRHGASAIAVLDPAHGIGPLTVFETLDLALTHLQQPGGWRMLSLLPTAFSITFIRWNSFGLIVTILIG